VHVCVKKMQCRVGQGGMGWGGVGWDGLVDGCKFISTRRGEVKWPLWRVCSGAYEHGTMHHCVFVSCPGTWNDLVMI
jgi:hypothetical protein